MASPILRYIGHRDVNAEGKVLFEILAQLKNFGVGRIVTKNEWARKWPTQPSYCIVRKVEPQMDRWLRHGTMWADFVYRGKPLGTVEFERQVDRSDWRLIHKKDEKTFMKCDNPFVCRRLPTKVPLPPLQRFWHQQKQMKAGKDAKDLPMLPNVHYSDEDHHWLNDYIEFSDELNPKPDGSIYDVDPNIFYDLYGEQLPWKVERWHSSAKFLQEAAEQEKRKKK